MKKQISDFIKSLGERTAYSGKTKTLYIKPVYIENLYNITDKVIARFGDKISFEIRISSF